jgi:uncharacterized protein (UPF0264 family)
LIDTFDKRGGSLLDHLPWTELVRITHEANPHGVRLALAGSLAGEHICELLPLRPAYLGFRGAACRGGRDGTIDSARVKTLALAVKRFTANRPA